MDRVAGFPSSMFRYVQYFLGRHSYHPKIVYQPWKRAKMTNLLLIIDCQSILLVYQW